LVHLPERVGFNPIKVSNDCGNILVETWGHLSSKGLSR
jgi:hypothetical protein